MQHKEVEAVLKMHLKKKMGKADPAIVPKLIGIETGPFSILPTLLESEVLLQIMFYTMYNVLVLMDVAGTTPPLAKAILNQVLYLVMVAIGEWALVFSHLSALKIFEDGKNLINVVCAMGHTKHFKSFMAWVGWILGEMSRFVPEEVEVRRRVVPAVKAGVNTEMLKEHAAKVHQEAQMKAQQANFFKDMDDDDDEEMNEALEELV